MTPDRENVWLETLERQCGIRRALIVHGAIADVCFSTEQGDYLPVVQVVLQVLKRRGFEHVVLWDRFRAIQNVSAAARASLERAATREHAPPRSAGQPYDLGEADDAGKARGDAPGPVGTAPPDPCDFLALVHHCLVNEPRARHAFVIDWSQYLFGSDKAPSERERQWLLMLSKAIRDAPLKLDAESLGKPSSVVVLLCRKLAAIPPEFYQDNPLVYDIAVPLPSRPDREAFLKRTASLWLLRRPLRPGTADFNDAIDALDGFCLRDLQQMIKLSRQVGGEPAAMQRIIALYRYGETASPWEELSRAKLDKLQETLGQWVKGQDEAISRVRAVIIRAFTGLSGIQHSRKRAMPKGVLFLVGPTGVGKTEMAKALARFLFGDEDACIRLDMSEYNHEHSDQRLVGAPPGYVGYEEGGQLTNAVKRRPFSVLLFDEVEKAHPRILDKFLQIL